MPTDITPALDPAAATRRREIDRLARDLYGAAQDLASAVGELVPADLSRGDTAGLAAVSKALGRAVAAFGVLGRAAEIKGG